MLLGLIALLAAAPVQAAPPCGERDAVLRAFADKFGETPAKMAITEDGRLLELLKSEAGTWTIVITTPGGPTCGMAAGTAWIDAPEQKPGEPL